jgi:hypothetical protein
MPTLVVERFAPPAGSRDARERAYCCERVAEQLAERTVWCSTRLVSGLEQLLAGQAVVREYAGGRVSRDDVVVLDDAPSALAVREHGAHAVISVTRLPDARDAAVDAYLVAWTGSGPLACRLAAVMPRADRVTEKDTRGRGDELAWSSLLADIVSADREERVGGRRHVRPAVAVH